MFRLLERHADKKIIAYRGRQYLREVPQIFYKILGKAVLESPPCLWEAFPWTQLIHSTYYRLKVPTFALLLSFWDGHSYLGFAYQVTISCSIPNGGLQLQLDQCCSSFEVHTNQLGNLFF